MYCQETWVARCPVSDVRVSYKVSATSSATSRGGAAVVRPTQGSRGVGQYRFANNRHYSRVSLYRTRPVLSIHIDKYEKCCNRTRKWLSDIAVFFLVNLRLQTFHIASL